MWILDIVKFSFRKSMDIKDAETTSEVRFKKNETIYVIFVDLMKETDNLEWNKMFKIWWKMEWNVGKQDSRFLLRNQ